MTYTVLMHQLLDTVVGVGRLTSQIAKTPCDGVEQERRIGEVATSWASERW